MYVTENQHSVCEVCLRHCCNHPLPSVVGLPSHGNLNSQTKYRGDIGFYEV
jgi:hypothetical protein